MDDMAAKVKIMWKSFKSLGGVSIDWWRLAIEAVQLVQGTCTALELLIYASFR